MHSNRPTLYAKKKKKKKIKKHEILVINDIDILVRT